MSYLVLARKYRPQSFPEVIGQEHISKLLESAITSNKTAHAYLFTGPRGVGKTSCARILAKSLNCEKGPTLNPCNECSACQEISKGTSFDVLEIDGASNRGIDEIRALRENVKFAPNYARFKVYIVDEVHMLTMEAFNALLKTLEEPPDYVKFILATTAPNKIPATIISRCQRFDFKRIPMRVIIDTLAAICQKEGFKVDQNALYAIGKAAQGGLRDALSILDQLGAINDRVINTDDVYSMLGLVETQILFDITNALANQDCSAALEALEHALEKGKDTKQLLKDITEHFRNLMIIKIGGKNLEKMVDYPGTIKALLDEQAQLFTIQEILRAIDVLIEAQEVGRVTETLQLPIELAFAKLTVARGNNPVEMSRPAPTVPQPTKPVIQEKPAAQPVAKPAASAPVTPTSKPPVRSAMPNETVKPLDAPTTGTLTLETFTRLWDTITLTLSKERMSLGTCLMEGHPTEFKDNRLTIGFLQKFKFQKESFDNSANAKVVEKIISDLVKRPIGVQFKITDASVATPKEEEGVVKQMLDTFGGTVVNRWHTEA